MERTYCRPADHCHPERSEGSAVQKKDPLASPRDDFVFVGWVGFINPVSRI
jgi:hypothetical protein